MNSDFSEILKLNEFFLILFIFFKPFLFECTFVIPFEITE